jgi:uncharacterized Zn-binding protein involved in type VI secretion
MPAIVVEGELSQGHDAFPPVPAIPGSPKVTIEGKKVILEGDSYAPHHHGGDHPHLHTPIASVGSPTVFVNGIGVVRDGDPLNCGDAADTQSNFSVFANGGGNAASIIAGFGGNEGETLGYSVIGITDSYPTLSARARYSVSLGSLNERVRTFQEWCPTTPVNPNGFQITLKEETTGTNYTSLRGVGATFIPVTAPATIRGPLDSRVSYTLENFNYPPQPDPTNPEPRYNITDYYSINSSTGEMTFTRSAGVTITHTVPGVIKISYGTGEILFKKINVNARIGAGTGAC